VSTANLVAVVSVVVLSALLVAAAVAIAMPKLRKRHVPGRLAGVAFVVLYPIALGFGFASQTTRGPGGVSLGNAVYVFGLFALLPLAVLVISPRFRPWLTALVLAYGFAMLLEIFSLVYWDHGTSRNFSTPLSHLDAFYFALGTLTTGTGNISAISETSRRIQTAQMVIDLVFIGFIVALVMARYSTLLDRSHRELPRDAAGTRDQYAALLPIQERVLGPEHPDTLTTRHRLALWTGKAGNPAEARDQYTALLPIRERVLGPEHPATLATRQTSPPGPGRGGMRPGPVTSSPTCCSPSNGSWVARIRTPSPPAASSPIGPGKQGNRPRPATSTPRCCPPPSGY
jgi:Tetratricopeptide repeat